MSLLFRLDDDFQTCSPYTNTIYIKDVILDLLCFDKQKEPKYSFFYAELSVSVDITLTNVCHWKVLTKFEERVCLCVMTLTQ